MKHERSLPQDPNEVRMSFGEHLEELRWRLIRAIIGLAVGTGICLYFGAEILGFLIGPFNDAMIANGYKPELVNIDPTETFMRYFHTALVFGVGVSAPYAFYQLWQFVAAGLYPGERRWVAVFAPASMALFFLGVVFLVKVVLPLAMRFLVGSAAWVPTPNFHNAPRYATTAPATRPANLPILRAAPEQARDGDAWISEEDGSLNVVVGGRTLRFSGTEASADQLVRPMYSLQMYLEFVNGMCLAFGLGFQIPIVIVVLTSLRIVSAVQLARTRKMTLLLIAVAGAVLTPSGDVSSQLLLAVPMWLLFELGLLTARIMEKHRAASAS